MELDLANILTIAIALVSGGAFVLAWVFSQKKTDIELSHKVEELQTLFSNNSKRLDIMEEAYNVRRVDDALNSQKIAHIEKMVSEIVVRLLDQKEKGGNL